MSNENLRLKGDNESYLAEKKRLQVSVESIRAECETVKNEKSMIQEMMEGLKNSSMNVDDRYREL